MAKLVIELQKECLNPALSYANLFQKAYFIAKKLEQKEMVDFLKNGIDGYKKQKDVPDYRYINVVYKAKNPMRGWIPVSIPSDSPLIKYLRYPIFQSVSELESLISTKGDALIMSIPVELQELFISQSIGRIPFEICAHFSDSQIKTILETEKRMISDWALDLERKGILGDEYQFTEQEKKRASDMTIINNYGNINGANIVGTATNSTLNVNNTNSFDYEGVEKLLESIQNLLPVGNFIKNDLEKIQQNVDEIKESISKQDVPSVKGKLKDLADFCKGIAGNVIASGVWAQIQSFLC